jgi:hypothetical protein
MILLNTSLPVQNKSEIIPFLFPCILKTLLKSNAEEDGNICAFSSCPSKGILGVSPSKTQTVYFSLHNFCCQPCSILIMGNLHVGLWGGPQYLKVHAQFRLLCVLSVE